MIQLPSSSFSPWQHTTQHARVDNLPSRVDVCVVGAGIAGVATTSMLLDRGLTVALVDAQGPGFGTTGRSSAKVSVLHGHHAERIADKRGKLDAEQYVKANRWGFDWVADQVDDLPDCGWESCSAITYANDASGEQAIARERDVLVASGIDASLETLNLPWGTHRAVVCPDQAQFDPQRFVDGMVHKLVGRGGSIHFPVRVTRVVEHSDHVEADTTAGPISANHVVVATGIPFLDRGLHFARTVPRTSHVVGVLVRDQPPPGVYISTGEPLRSVRTASDDSGRRIVLVGGEGHRTGSTTETLERQRILVDWADENLGVTEVTHRFSADDYETPDLVPFAGPIRPGSERIHVLTGMNKWGFTNSPASAAVVVAHIDDTFERPEWSELYSSTRLPTAGIGELAKAGLDVGRYALTGWAKSIRRDPQRPGRPLGDGPERPCAASGVCTHLGGIVRWNDAAETWDCPLHGSRFAADGTMVHGPATKDLPHTNKDAR